MHTFSASLTCLAAKRSLDRNVATPCGVTLLSTGSLALLLTLALGACGGGADGANGTNGTNGLTTLVLATAEPAGAHCAAGGAKISAGLDTNADGTLVSTEISSTQYVCKGSAAAAGTNGTTSLVRMSAEAAGANCAASGTLIGAGLDTNGNGVLDSAEVTSTTYVCAGSTGAAGATRASGATGSTGTAGTPGATGATGANGLTSLIALVTEPAGLNCTFGGQKATAGLDANRNGVLDASEITTTTYVCNGATGAAGTNGSTGATGATGPASPGST
jgi:hypothetical protein